MKLVLAVLADLCNPLIMVQIQVLGKTVTEPWLDIFYANDSTKKKPRNKQGRH